MKFLISFLLKTVPRKYLQLFSHFFLKIISIFYLGKVVSCPVCNHNFRKFLPYGRQSRENALCPNCLALERHRLMWIFLRDRTNFNIDELKVLHIAPELCFIKRFEAMENIEYTTADLESPLAKVKMDVHEMPFDDNSFDVVFCNHVMEHVREDRLAMSEILRVLRPGGWAIIQIPVFSPRPDTTIEDPTITDPKEREKLFGQDDHVRLYGLDYPERLRAVGFKVDVIDLTEELGSEAKDKFALPLNDPIHYCTKPH